MLSLVEHVALDKASPTAEASIRKVCKNLQGLSLDAMHLVFRVQADCGRSRQSKSLQKFFRTIASKLECPDYDHNLGPMFTGLSLVPLDDAERAVRITSGAGALSVQSACEHIPSRRGRAVGGIFLPMCSSLQRWRTEAWCASRSALPRRSL